MITPLKLPFLLEHFAVAVSAISGVLAARGKRVDLFGVLVLAVVTAFGGGTVRDVLLGDQPIFWVRQPAYLYNAVLTALVMFLVVRYQDLSGRGLLVADAFALALFSIVGAHKALLFNTPPLAATAMGVVTGVAGGMLRDVLLMEIPLVFRRQIHFYATASLAGAGLFVVLEEWVPHVSRNMLLGVGVTLALRLLSLKYKLALPEMPERK
ncbi:trimeric intracellular cation channel family protein [Fontisphaera persica]|uniref:trimeric intracellular cation channel family protein n=1 Tax=Fontisphaera persica TaxID=2974023 RepID=UPI0024C00DD5|nr:trimeric intracellular cation channel family protein [Fontisphaera persica]WCJ59858.1 trimeric intracellular cation channel family protein [Fontisphaera persica]